MAHLPRVGSVSHYWCLALDVLWGTDVAECLPLCPLCGVPSISVVHCLCHCPATAAFFTELATSVHAPTRTDISALIPLVLGPCASIADRLSHICFVGRCIHAVLLWRSGEQAVLATGEEWMRADIALGTGAASDSHSFSLVGDTLNCWSCEVARNFMLLLRALHQLIAWVPFTRWSERPLPCRCWPPRPTLLVWLVPRLVPRLAGRASCPLSVRLPRRGVAR